MEQEARGIRGKCKTLSTRLEVNFLLSCFTFCRHRKREQIKYTGLELEKANIKDKREKESYITHVELQKSLIKLSISKNFILQTYIEDKATKCEYQLKFNHLYLGHNIGVGVVTEHIIIKIDMDTSRIWP
jgi:hypothetical protein